MDVPNKETLQAMNNVLEGKNLSKTFETVSELIEDLNAKIRYENRIKSKGW